MTPPRLALLVLSGIALLGLACAQRPDSVRIEPAATPVAGDRTGAAPPDPTHPPAGIGASGSGTTTTRRPAATAAPSAAATPDARAEAPVTAGDQRVLAAIESALGDDAEHYSVVVRRLRDGRGAALNPDHEYYAASLFKLALLYEAMRQRSAGTLNFDTGMEVTAEVAEEDLGTFSSLGVGIGGHLPVSDAVRAMVTRSDNTSAVLMLHRLGHATVDRTLAGVGLTATSVNTRDLPTTAADMALLMEAIVRGAGVDAAARAEMLGLLADQETRYGIPALLPAAVRVGNKTGTWPTATHDVAYVDAPTGAYVIAVLSDRGWVWDPIARVSRAVYDAMVDR